MTILDQTDTQRADGRGGGRRAGRAAVGRRIGAAARTRSPTPTGPKLAPLLLVAIAIGFNLFVLRGELARVADLNDTGVHISMVRWAEHRLSSGPARLRRLVPAARARAPAVPPLPEPPAHHRRRARDRLRRRAHGDVDLLPAVSRSGRSACTSRSGCSGSAAGRPAAPRCSRRSRRRSPLYGYEHGSYTWRGNGVWSQLWGMWLFPLALALTWRAVSTRQGLRARRARRSGSRSRATSSPATSRSSPSGIWVLIVPAASSCAGSAAPRPSASAARSCAAWVVVPLLARQQLRRRAPSTTSAPSGPTRTAAARSWSGCSPASSSTTAAGPVLSRARRPRRGRVRAGASCGTSAPGRSSPSRSSASSCSAAADTIGFAIDLLPGGKDLLLHRFIIPVHLGGLLLAGIGVVVAAPRAPTRASRRWRPRLSPVAGRRGPDRRRASSCSFPAWRERDDFDAQGASWIDDQRESDATVRARLHRARQARPTRSAAAASTPARPRPAASTRSATSRATPTCSTPTSTRSASRCGRSA